jgi:hypothetical protein
VNKAFLAIIAAFLRIRKDLRAAIFAHAVAPLLSVALAACWGAGGSPLLTATGNVSVIELSTELDTRGNVTARPGLGVILQPEDSDVTFAMPADVKTLRSSLTPSESRANRSHIELNHEVVTLRGPFRYVETPALFILDGLPPKEAGLLGGHTSLKNLSAPARHSPAIIVSLMLVVAFSLGLAFTAPGAVALIEFLQTADVAKE